MTSKQFISRILELGAELDKATAVVDCNRIHEEAEELYSEQFENAYTFRGKDLKVFKDPNLLTPMHDCSERIGCQSYDTNKCHKACNFYNKKK